MGEGGWGVTDLTGLITSRLLVFTWLTSTPLIFALEAINSSENVSLFDRWYSNISSRGCYLYNTRGWEETTISNSFRSRWKIWHLKYVDVKKEIPLRKKASACEKLDANSSAVWCDVMWWCVLCYAMLCLCSRSPNNTPTKTKKSPTMITPRTKDPTLAVKDNANFFFDMW